MPAEQGEAVSAIVQHNRLAWDRMARQQHRFARPASDSAIWQAADGTERFQAWAGNLRGKRLLCLAAGGGRHGPLYAAAGAEVTVVDLSPRMLELDRLRARQRGLALTTVEASMDDLSMFGPASFDVVLQPVSTCYVPDVLAVYREVARVVRPGGLYLSQHKNPVSLQADIRPSAQGYQLIEPYYRSGPLPDVAGSRFRESGTLEFLHRLEELLGGMCRVGFVIEDFCEPRHADPAAAVGSFAHRSHFVAPYLSVRARRQVPPAAKKSLSSIWIPDGELA